MLTTHRRIQEIVFDGGNVTQYLRKMIEHRFAVSDVPDGFLFFPVELGGLNLRSPFVDPLQIRDSVEENPYNELDEFLEQEHDDYLEAKRAFDKRDTKLRYNMEYADFLPEAAADEFFSYNEYVRYREEFASSSPADLRATFEKLLCLPAQQRIENTAELNLALGQLRGQNLHGITPSWHSMTAYWQYMASAHGPQILERFGGLNIVEPGWLPIGMVSQFRQRRTTWQD
jgi:hypothetical protein